MMYDKSKFLKYVLVFMSFPAAILVTVINSVLLELLFIAFNFQDVQGLSVFIGITMTLAQGIALGIYHLEKDN